MDNFIGQSVEKQVGKMEDNTQEINQNTGKRERGRQRNGNCERI